MVGEAAFSATSGLMSSHGAEPKWVLPLLIVLAIAVVIAIRAGKNEDEEEDYDEYTW